MTALAERVDAVFSTLREAEQRALAMREREGADYRAIAAALDTGREGVADLLVGARLGVWSALHGAPPPARRTAQCGPARRVLAAQADGEAVSASDAERAREHVAACEPCAAARVALREAELACRAWNRVPSVPLATSRVPSVPESGTRAPRVSATGTSGTRLAEGRRRLIAAAATLLLFIAIVVAAVTNGSDAPPRPAAPQTGPGSAQGSANDVVPPPGDRFCPQEQPDCR